MQIHGINTKLSFNAYKSEFSKRLEDTLAKPDLKKEQELSLDFKIAFPNLRNRKSYIEGGCYNDVYKIDDVYVMRVPKDDDIRITKLHKPEQNNLQDLIKKLKTYYGAVIAYFGNVEIMKNAIGDKDEYLCPVCPNSIIQCDEKLQYFQNKYLPNFASLPQSAYDNIAYDFKLMNQYKTSNGYTYSFDILNPRNFMQVGDEIRVVDEIDDERALFACDNKLINMLKVFFSSGYGISYDNYKAVDMKNLHTILAKCIVAAEKAGLAWGDFEQYACNYSDCLHNAGVDLSVQEVKTMVDKIQDNDIDKRADKLNKMLMKLFADNKLVKKEFTDVDLSFIL